MLTDRSRLRSTSPSTSADHAVIIDPLLAERIEGAARSVGAALRLLGDRRRGQCDRQAHPACAAENGYDVDAILPMARPRRALDRRRERCRARRALKSSRTDGSYSKSDDHEEIGGYVY